MEAVFEKEELVKKYKSAITAEKIDKVLASLFNKSFKNLTASSTPLFKITTGPCGMGKTTFTNNILQKDPNYVWLNSDSIRFALDDVIFNGEIRQKHPDLLSGIFSDLARDLREKLGIATLSKNYNTILDCVLIKQEIIQNLLFPAHKQGYKISACILTGNIMTGITRVFNRYTKQVAENGSGHMVTPQWQKEVLKMFLEDIEKFLLTVPLSNITIINEDDKEIFISSTNPEMIFSEIKNKCCSPLNKTQKEKLQSIWQDTFNSLEKIIVSDDIKSLYETTYQDFLKS